MSLTGSSYELGVADETEQELGTAGVLVWYGIGEGDLAVVVGGISGLRLR